MEKCSFCENSKKFFFLRGGGGGGQGDGNRELKLL